MNIYVGNLSSSTEESDLRELFAGHGEVSSAKIIKDRDTGLSRGFGFVEMPNVNEARQAIEELNEFEYQGGVLKVNESKPKPEGGFGGNRGGGFRGGNNRGGGNGGGGFNRRW